ncbi:MAG: carbon monoxide dehydrogenase maturation protein [Chloroflexi bacterium RBG_13_53_26]|nr:MAG: carbon monoxide dehydrogenase maturation protein [Chloroflexi bacterium RBG_13_53_26]
MSESLPPKKKRLVAVSGKGGTGKTAFTAMMTRALLDSSMAGRLLLIDADPALGLPSAIGVQVKRTMGQVREEIIRTARSGSQEEKAQLGEMLDYMVLEALIETDSFALLAMGRTETQGCFCPVNDLLRGAIEMLSRSFDTIIIDGEAGVEQINRQVVRHLDTLIVVSDATARGLQTASLIRRMISDDRVIRCDKLGLVFNRVQGNEELLRRSAGEIGIEVLGFVPHDEAIGQFDLIGRPITELPAGSPGLVAVRAIVEGHVIGQ